MRVIVYHEGYGCDTGCCGHVVYLKDDDGKTVRQSDFEFGHPDLYNKVGEERDKEIKEWAEWLVTEKFGEEHCKDLDWLNSYIVDDL